MAERVQDPPDIVYPESDGKPMAESMLQWDWVTLIKSNIGIMLAADVNVLVAGDLLWYPVEGHPEISTAPDTMVVFGRPKGRRPSYRQWVEDGIAPQVTFEVLSPSNTRREMDAKREWYQQYGVEEYYEYDPERVRLRGWIREGDEFCEIKEMHGWVSPRLRIRFDMGGEELTIFGADGRPFQMVHDSLLERDAERRRAERLAEKLRELGIDPNSLS